MFKPDLDKLERYLMHEMSPEEQTEFEGEPQLSYPDFLEVLFRYTRELEKEVDRLQGSSPRICHECRHPHNKGEVCTSMMAPHIMDHSQREYHCGCLK